MSVARAAARARRVASGQVSEHEIHVALARLLRAAGLAFHHSPNGSMAAPQYRAKLSALGMSPGWPDLVIVTPNRWGRPSAIELKAARGRVSPEQERWGEVMTSAGWSWAVAYGLEDAVETLRTWGYQV